MITSHDAATSYFTGKTCEGVATEESDWLVTQTPGTWKSQLDCGARAFDLRLLSKNGRLVTHHGAIGINVEVMHLLSELKAWQAENPNELVLVYGSHCSGFNCSQMFHSILDAADVPHLECSEIKQLTLGAALKIGSLLAVDGCVQVNYNRTISCYKENAGEAGASSMGAAMGAAWDLIDNCHGPNSERFLDALWANLATVSDGRGENQSYLWMAQAHWQYSAWAYVQGTALGSCVLKDESGAGVNTKLAAKISAGEFPHLNLLEVDNVCDGDGSGQKLFAALRRRFTMDLGMSAEEALLV